MKTYIGFSRDHSGSMSSLAKAAMDDFNKLVAGIRKNAIDNSVDTIVSVMECGRGTMGDNNMVVKNSSVLGVKPLECYITDGGSTPLFDSVGELIDAMMNVPDAKDPDVNFLVMVITDGQDNASRKYVYSIGQTIQQLQSTDRWSFTFRVPRGAKRTLVSKGIPEGNILEWELSAKGMELSGTATSQAIDSFYASKVAGIQSTRSFYETDLTGVSTQKIAANLKEVTNEVQLFSVPSFYDGGQIRDFVEAHIPGQMKKGAAFYQLTKKEDEVQEYKQICIRDKKSGKVYAGVHARQLLGLPFSGTVKIHPGNHGNYDIFIQSTSVNRKLVQGTSVLYWEAVGEDYKEPKKSVARTVAAAPTQKAQVAKSSQELFKDGYNDGFEDGKAKKDRRKENNPRTPYDHGYDEGYKHGRGKKKRLYHR